MLAISSLVMPACHQHLLLTGKRSRCLGNWQVECAGQVFSSGVLKQTQQAVVTSDLFSPAGYCHLDVQHC